MATNSENKAEEIRLLQGIQGLLMSWARSIIKRGRNASRRLAFNNYTTLNMYGGIMNFLTDWPNCCFCVISSY